MEIHFDRTDRALQETCLTILRKLRGYWEARECPGRHGTTFQYSEHENKAFSARLLSDVMLGYLALALHDDDDVLLRKAESMIKEILSKQDEDGAFRWNLPDPYCLDPRGVRDQVDLAMTLDALGLFLDSGLLEERTISLIKNASARAIGYLRTVMVPGRPGVVRKRHYGDGANLDVDVLNGDAMAAKAFFLASKMGDESVLDDEIGDSLEHLAERFGKHGAGWWVYSESLKDGSSLSHGRAGMSVFFQAMMVFHLRDVAADMSFSFFRPVLQKALESVVASVNDNGEIDVNVESRFEFPGKPNALVAACLATGEGIPEKRKALARFQLIDRLLISPKGEVRDEEGQDVSDIWRVWTFSDVARCSLHLTKNHPLTSGNLVQMN